MRKIVRPPRTLGLLLALTWALAGPALAEEEPPADEVGPTAAEGAPPAEGVEPAGAESAVAPDSALDEDEADPASDQADPFKPIYLVESIDIEGDPKTTREVVLSHIHFKVGDALEEEKVELSRIRLLALGYFREVEMRLRRGSERGKVRVVIRLLERNSIIIDDLFMGYSRTNEFWGGLGVSDINFAGLGLALSGAFVASADQQAARLGVFWPSILGTRFQAGVQALFVHGRERALLDAIEDAAGQRPGHCAFDRPLDLPYLRAGGLVNLGIRLDPEHRISLALQTEHVEADLYVPSVDGQPCGNYPFQGYIRNGQSTLSSLTFKFERDTRDDYFMPTRGMHLVVSIELGSKIFGSDYEYSKYMIFFEHSFTLWLDHVLRLSVLGGLIQDVGAAGSPFFKRFFVGDHALFLIDKGSLPRNLDVNFSEVVDYGDLLGSVEAEYDVPLWSGGSYFYRGYFYAALNFCYVTKASFLASKDEWSGRTKRPVSFDLGLKFDTPIGLFTLALGYIMDVAF
jgi:outer membrane protein assembly factor BamA